MKCLLIYNPFSRSRKVKNHIDFIVRYLGRKYDSIEIYCSKGIKSITKFVYERNRDFDLIVVCGGDGTVNEAINGLLKSDSKTPIGIIPTGTCNDLSKMLCFHKSLKKQLDLIINGTVVSMDTCKINDSFYTYAAAIGKYTDVSYCAARRAKRIFGRIAYFLAGLGEFGKYIKLQLKIKTDKNYIEGNYYVVLALNTDRVAGFKINREQNIKLNDGLIDLTLIEKNGESITWPRLAKFFIRGDKQKKGVHTFKTNHIEIISKEDLKVNTDGELAYNTKNVVIDVLPKTLNIVVSKNIKDKYF